MAMFRNEGVLGFEAGEVAELAVIEGTYLVTTVTISELV